MSSRILSWCLLSCFVFSAHAQEQQTTVYRVTDNETAIKFVLQLVEPVSCGTTRSVIMDSINEHGIPSDVKIDTGGTGYTLSWTRPWGVVQQLTANMNGNREKWELCMTRFVVDDSMTYSAIHAEET